MVFRVVKHGMTSLELIKTHPALTISNQMQEGGGATHLNPE